MVRNKIIVDELADQNGAKDPVLMNNRQNNPHRPTIPPYCDKRHVCPFKGLIDTQRGMQVSLVAGSSMGLIYNLPSRIVQLKKINIYLREKDIHSPAKFSIVLVTIVCLQAVCDMGRTSKDLGKLGKPVYFTGNMRLHP